MDSVRVGRLAVPHFLSPAAGGREVATAPRRGRLTLVQTGVLPETSQARVLARAPKECRSLEKEIVALPSGAFLITKLLLFTCLGKEAFFFFKCYILDFLPFYCFLGFVLIFLMSPRI